MVIIETKVAARTGKKTRSDLKTMQNIVHERTEQDCFRSYLPFDFKTIEPTSRAMTHLKPFFSLYFK